MSGITPYLAEKLLDHALRGDESGTDYEQPTAIYLALHTSAPSESGVGGEVSGGAYARQQILFNPAGEPIDDPGQISNSEDALFTMPACTVTHFSLWDAPTGGNCLFTNAMGTNQVFNSGDTYSPQPGALTITRLDG